MFWFERKEVCHRVGCHSGISVTNCHSPRSYCSSLALVTRMCRRTVWLLKAIISIIIFVTKNFFSGFCCRYVYSFITMVTRNGMAIPNPGFSLRDWRSHQQVPTLSSWVPPSPTHPSHRGLGKRCLGSRLEGVSPCYTATSFRTCSRYEEGRRTPHHGLL